MRKTAFSGLLGVFFALALITIPFALESCTGAKLVENKEYSVSARDSITAVRDTIRKEVYLHDSIFVRDSVIVLSKGDTITMEKWHTKYIYRNIAKADTLIKYRDVIVNKTDTLTQIKIITKEVEKPLTWWQRLRLNIGGYAIFIAIVALLIIGLGFYRSRI